MDAGQGNKTVTVSTSHSHVGTETGTSYNYNYCGSGGSDDRCLIIDGQTKVNLTTGQVEGPLPVPFKKVASAVLSADEQPCHAVHYISYANFHCFTKAGKLYGPIYCDVGDEPDEFDTPQKSLMLVNDELYGLRRDKYNYKTIYHHGLIMNNHLRDITSNGKVVERHLASIPPIMFDLAVILNLISPGLHLILIR